MRLTLAVVAYPELDEVDRQWIEGMRAEHDPQAGRIPAHLTLVFPVEVQDADVSAVAEEAAVAAASSPPISFTGRGPRAVPGAQGRGAHLFLVVDEGAERIRALHGRLYRGVLRPHHRTDGSFTPHVTVGASEDPSRCETLSREAGPRVVRGRLSRIDLLDVGGDRVRSIASFALRPHG